MVLAAPKLVEPQPIEMLHEIKVAPKLKHRMLADGVMRGEKGTKS
jgi:hypothetical protein